MSARKANRRLGAVAQLLIELSEDIELLGTALCLSPDFASQHMRELQAIDLIAQKQRSIAGMLLIDCPSAMLDQLDLDGLKQRLLALLQD